MSYDNKVVKMYFSVLRVESVKFRSAAQLSESIEQKITKYTSASK